jgi:hypothetical protein
VYISSTISFLYHCEQAIVFPRDAPDGILGTGHALPLCMSKHDTTLFKLYFLRTELEKRGWVYLLIKVNKTIKALENK